MTRLSSNLTTCHPIRTLAISTAVISGALTTRLCQKFQVGLRKPKSFDALVSIDNDHRVSSPFDLVVTDLDGTLWGRDCLIHPATRLALSLIEREKIPLLAATGRRIASTKEVLFAERLSVPAIMLDGAIGIEFDSEVRFHRQPFTAEHARAVLAAFQEVGIDPCCYVDEGPTEVYISDHPGTHPDHVRSFADTVEVVDLEAVVDQRAIFSIGVIGCPHEQLLSVEAATQSLARSMFNRSYTIDGWAFTVTARDVSKWSGVESYCARSGISPNRVLALGDGPNDIELLANATVSVSFEGAYPEAIAQADYLFLPPDQGGWAQLPGLLEID